MKISSNLKHLIFFFFLIIGNNSFAQDNLNRNLKSLEDELNLIGIKYNKNNEDRNAPKVAYKTGSDTKILYFKKDASKNLICTTEQTVMKYSEPLLEQTLSYFDALGYDTTNYQNYMGNPVKISSSNGNHKTKHYLHMLLMDDPNNDQETLLWIEYTTNTDEFKVMKQ